jgi:enoyl-CoA hydratase/carnithine racemase
VRVIGLEQLAGGIARVTIDRPAARNAMTFAMWDRLREVAVALDLDPAVKVVVITGAGDRAFVSGTDIAAFAGFTADDGVAYEARMERVMGALEAIRVPTIAAIAGACTGGGAALAACCDLRVGAPNARIGVPVARTLGNALAVGNLARVAQLIGLDKTKLLLLTGTLLDAQEAYRSGFLTHLVRDGESLSARALGLAADLTTLAPLTLRATKESCRRLRAAALPSDADVLRGVYGSRDFAEGVASFVEKRAPRWEGA